MANKKIAPLSPSAESGEAFSCIGSIALVVDKAGVERIGVFQKFRHELGVKEEDFKVVACVSSKENIESYEGLTFRPSGVSWLGKIKQNEVREFIKRPFDLLVSFCSEENKTSRLLVQKSNAILKVGRPTEGHQEADVTISGTFEEVDVFVEEVKKYLKILKKKH